MKAITVSTGMCACSRSPILTTMKHQGMRCDVIQRQLREAISAEQDATRLGAACQQEACACECGAVVQRMTLVGLVRHSLQRTAKQR
jgi:hypothetical protein